MSATETAKPTWRDLTQAIVATDTTGNMLVILTSKTEKSIARTREQAIAAGLTVQGDAPIVAKNELDIPKPEPTPAPQADGSDEHDAATKADSDLSDPRPDLPGKAPGTVPAPRRPRAPRKSRKSGDPQADKSGEGLSEVLAGK